MTDGPPAASLARVSEAPDPRDALMSRIAASEAEARRWLRRSSLGRREEADIIQEAYYRVWRSVDPGEVASPRAYFLQVVRNILFEHLRREKVVSFAALAEIDGWIIPSEEPGSERVVAATTRLRLVQTLLSELPGRCRRVMEMRKIDSRSQRETAHALGISENVVEKDVARALRHIMRRMAELETDLPTPDQSARPDAKQRYPG